MQESNFTPPFKTLGTRLKYLRERSAESLAEVSGAVEINEDVLDLIEQGMERPSEEILMLLINHFDMQEMDAVQLWELAGYDRRSGPEMIGASLTDEVPPTKNMIMMLALDTRAQYSDGVDIHLNNAGMVMTFTQAGGLNNQQQPVARVGMSLQQAEAVAETLQQALLKAKYMRTKALPASRPTAQSSKKSASRRTGKPHNDTSTKDSRQQ